MLRRTVLAALSLAVAGSLHAETPAPRDVPYAPGTITLEVDATNLHQRIFSVRETIPVQPGALTLLYPEWLPGKHAPRGPIDKIAGIRFLAGGEELQWHRDPLDVYALELQVPQGVSEITAVFDYLSPTDRSQGRVVMTPAMLNLQWDSMLFYPAGHHAHQVRFDPRVTYPAGWQAATALEVEATTGAIVDYRDVPLDILVDSPVFAGRHFSRIDLTPEGSDVPVRLNVVADAARYLEAKPEQLAIHRALVEQALKLFDSQHYDHYDFLLALTDQLGGIGLEHQRSSENSQDVDYFTGWKEKSGFSDLLAHEYTHSWNGKYRRPARLATPNFNVPMVDSLLWVYEGQTQYWGNVLAARSGMRPLQASLDALASVAATYAENRPGLAWRSIQDTTYDPVIAARAPRAYRNYQLSEDYYRGGQLVWLEADALIRNATDGRKSLDDFAAAFFGINDGEWKQPATYTFEDVVATLDGVLEHDWATFLRDRIDGKAGITDGLEAAGWRLVYKDEPTAFAKAGSGSGGDFIHSLGLSLGKDGAVGDVRWDGPAFDAGIGTGATIVAVNGQAYDKEVLEDAIRAARGGSAPIELLVKSFDRYRTVPVQWNGGLRYPHLERIEGKPDRLSKILAPR